jgi:membrane associated rhomboid family serine protease
MLPLRDNIPARRLPLVNVALIGANALVFLYQISLKPYALNQFVIHYGMVPARLELLHPQSWFPLLTAVFLHGGWLHFLSNMWILFIFGDNVEDRMGHVRYLSFYLLGGVVASLMQVVAFPSSRIPSIGASGAIAAVLGAYLLYFPRARVLTLIPIFIYPWIIEVSAFVYLGIWFFLQLFSGISALSIPVGASMGGVAWWAHVGGFVFGLLAARPFAQHPAVSYEKPISPLQPPDDWSF